MPASCILACTESQYGPVRSVIADRSSPACARLQRESSEYRTVSAQIIKHPGGHGCCVLKPRVRNPIFPVVSADPLTPLGIRSPEASSPFLQPRSLVFHCPRGKVRLKTLQRNCQPDHTPESDLWRDQYMLCPGFCRKRLIGKRGQQSEFSTPRRGSTPPLAPPEMLCLGSANRIVTGAHIL